MFRDGMGAEREQMTFGFYPSLYRCLRGAPESSHVTDEREAAPHRSGT